MANGASNCPTQDQQILKPLKVPLLPSGTRCMTNLTYLRTPELHCSNAARTMSLNAVENALGLGPD